MRTIFILALIAAAAFAEYTNATDDTWTQSGIHTSQGPGYLGQINDHNCGPHSLMQAIFKITGIDMKEATLASWAGTTTSGTSHEGLEAALKKFNSNYGKKLTMTWYNFHDVTTKQIGEWMAGKNSAIFFHLLYRNKWGHYELPYKIVSGSSTLTIANSLGTKTSSGGFNGYFEERSWSDQKSYIAGISQKSVCVIKA